LLKLLLVVTMLAGWGGETAGQEPAPQEMSSTSSPFTLKVERNEVPVRVIVRDAQGRPVRNLTKNDFLILDNGKPQVITGFSTEGGARPASAPASGAAKPAPAAKPPASQVANRFVAFLFDDLVADFEGLSRGSTAASKYLQTSLKPDDRVAVFTSSGIGNLAFTSDRIKLQKALSDLRPHPYFATTGNECPPLSDYEAYQIARLNDSLVLQAVTGRVIECLCHGNASMCGDAQAEARAAAEKRWSTVENEAVDSLRSLEKLARTISVLPGQRTIVFVSPGFISGSQLHMISDIVDLAIHAGVVVNTLDPRGLYTVDPQSASDTERLDTEAVLGELADGTGGVYFHNNNNLDRGFQEAGGLPEFSYVLVFSPNPLKLDGKYHHLTVRLTAQARQGGFTLQTRRGYAAPRSSPDSAQAKREEFYNVLYSRDELNPTLIRIGTSFFKTGPAEAQVTIVAHLDPQVLNLRTENGLHVGEVTFLSVLFDNNGNFVQGLEKQFILHLRDATLAKLRSAGIAVSDQFKVPPGTYMVREIVKDQGGVLSSANDTFEIPY
jgi:VWFA-related protein